nr:hypothetical protein [Sphingomicrobium aestuariivivum]
MRIYAPAMPAGVQRQIEADIAAVPDWLDTPEVGIDAAHLFVTSKSALEAQLAPLVPLLARDGMIWVSWPKKASGLATELDREAVRDHGLSYPDLVDVKVCAVDATWSALKFVIRKEAR